MNALEQFNSLLDTPAMRHPSVERAFNPAVVADDFSLLPDDAPIAIIAIASYSQFTRTSRLLVSTNGIHFETCFGNPKTIVRSEWCQVKDVSMGGETGRTLVLDGAYVSYGSLKVLDPIATILRAVIQLGRQLKMVANTRTSINPLGELGQPVTRLLEQDFDSKVWNSGFPCICLFYNSENEIQELEKMAARIIGFCSEACMSEYEKCDWYALKLCAIVAVKLDMNSALPHRFGVENGHLCWILAARKKLVVAPNASISWGVIKDLIQVYFLMEAGIDPKDSEQLKSAQLKERSHRAAVTTENRGYWILFWVGSCMIGILLKACNPR